MANDTDICGEYQLPKDVVEAYQQLNATALSGSSRKLQERVARLVGERLCRGSAVKVSVVMPGWNGHQVCIQSEGR